MESWFTVYKYMQSENSSTWTVLYPVEVTGKVQNQNRRG